MKRLSPLIASALLLLSLFPRSALAQGRSAKDCRAQLKVAMKARARAYSDCMLVTDDYRLCYRRADGTFAEVAAWLGVFSISECEDQFDAMEQRFEAEEQEDHSIGAKIARAIRRLFGGKRRTANGVKELLSDQYYRWK